MHKCREILSISNYKDNERANSQVSISNTKNNFDDSIDDHEGSGIFQKLSQNRIRTAERGIVYNLN